MRALLSCFGKFPLSHQLSIALAFPLLLFRFNRKTNDAKFLSVLIFLSASLASSFSTLFLACASLLNFVSSFPNHPVIVCVVVFGPHSGSTVHIISEGGITIYTASVYSFNLPYL